MIQGGLPMGASVIIQGPQGPEKLRVALAFLAEGLKTGSGGLAVVSSMSAESVLAELREFGVDVDRAIAESRVRIIDRNPRNEGTPPEPIEKGEPAGFPRDLLNLGLAISRAHAALRGTGPKRAVVEVLTSLSKRHGVRHAHVFAQTAKYRFDRLRVTSLFVVDEDVHSSTDLATLCAPFDGVVDIERTGEGNSAVRKVAVQSMKDTRHDSAYQTLPERAPGSEGLATGPDRNLEGPSTRRGVTAPCPVCEAPTSLSAASCSRCGLRFLYRAIAPETEHLPVPRKVHGFVRKDGTGESRAPRIPEEPRPLAKPIEGTRDFRERESRRGFTNGLARERTQVRSQGLTNGLGRTNGLTNGVGRTNGLTNGTGRTNGLAKGVGRTNGLAASGRSVGVGHPVRLSHKGRRIGWKWYLLPLVGAVVLLIPLVSVPEYAGQTRPIQIDGQFSDWPASVLIAQALSAAANSDVDIQRFGVFDNVDRLAFYAEVRGQAFSGGGSPSRFDTLRVFLDTDRDPGTGYSVAGIGADRLLTVAGWGNRINVTTLQEWDAIRGPTDWNGWGRSSAIVVAVLGSRMEFEVEWDSLMPGKGPVYAYAHSQSHDLSIDETDFVFGTAEPSLVVEMTSVSPENLSAPDAPFLALNIASPVATSSYSSLTVTMVGSAQPSSIPSLRLVDGVGTTVQSMSPVSREVTFQFPARTLAAGQSETLVVRGDPSGLTGETLGFTIAEPGRVVADGVVTLRYRPSLRTVGYLGSAPVVPRIDGGFSEWTNFSMDPLDVARRADVDLRAYGVLGDVSSVYLLMQTEGRAFQGSLVPQLNSLANWNAGEPDSDRDTVPDIIDAFPFDFDNDGRPDAAANGDYDGDVVVDHPLGPDWYLNTTIPANFPPPYADRFVSLYIGPMFRPAVFGEDVARVLIDADGDASTGFRVNVLGADYLTEVRGRSGRLTYQMLSEFAGAYPLDWRWTPILPLVAATDYARIEASFASAGLGIGNNSSAYFEVMDWALSKDGSIDPVLQIGATTEQSSAPSRTPAVVRTLDIPGNEKWFFTNTNSAESVCTSNKDATLTPGATPASTTLAQGESSCWYSPNAVPDTLSGIWEVILDIDRASDGSQTFLPSANGDVNGWAANGCAEASEYLCVDDDPNDGDGTYIDSTDGAPLDSLFNIPDWGSPPSPLSATVTIEASCRRTAGAPVDVRILLKSGGTPSVGPTVQNCANSATYSVWAEAWTTDPADGGPWTATDINGLQIGVRDNDGTTREVRVSHVKATVTFAPVYSVEINKCENAGCTLTTNLYPATNFNAYGSDVTIQTGTIPAQTLVGLEHIQWKITLLTGGTVTIRYNGPNPGTDDSRATIPIPEFQEVAIPVAGVLLLIAAFRWRARRRSTRSLSMPS